MKNSGKKSKLVWRFCFLLVLIVIGQDYAVRSGLRSVSAQTVEGSPTGAEVLRNAAKASLQIPALTYNFEQETLIDNKYVLTAKGFVYQARADVKTAGFLPGKYSVSGTSSLPGRPTQPFAFSYNGAAFRILDPDSKAVLVINSPSSYVVGQMIGMDKGALGFAPLSDTEPFSGLINKADKIEYEGIVEINGTRCHAVAITMTFEPPGYQKTTSVVHWYFDTKDYLPRRFETKVNRVTMGSLEVKKQIDDSKFFLEIPNGYGEKLVTGKEARSRGLLAIGSLAPDWTLSTPEGRMVSLKDYRGKVVVMDFWGTWCYPCRKTMPMVQALYNKFKDRGVIVFGISVADEDSDPVAYMKQQKYSYGLLMKGDDVAKIYAAIVLPTLYVIGPDGKILHAEFGHRDSMGAQLEALIANTLKRQ